MLLFAVFALVTTEAAAPSAQYSATEVIVSPRDAAALSTIEGMGYTVLSTMPGSGYRLMKVRSGLTVEQAVAELSALGLLNSVEPNFRIRALATTPNDPSFASQYHHATMRCTEAWDYTTGVASETIAIVDGGVDTIHTDLSSRLVIAAGIDILENDSYPAEPMSGTGHATMVSGLAGAATNNGIDIAGVDWNSKMLVVRVLDQNGSGYHYNTALGIRKAVEHKATVINLSLGETVTYTYEALEDALLYARNSGVPVFVASGNNANESRDSAVAYPANSKYAYAVGSTTSADTRASTSAYRKPDVLYGVDICAPGDNVLTLSPGATTTYQSGTSLAAPLVSAAAALLKALRPEYTPANIIALMQATAKDLGPTGYDDQTGYGRLDLYNLLFSSRTASIYPFSNDTNAIRVDSFVYTPGEVRTATVSAAGRRGRNALTLTGDDIYCGYASSLNADSGTIEFYLKYNSSSISDTHFIVTQKGLSAKTKGHLDLVMLPDSRIQYSLYDSGMLTSTTKLNPNQWYHVGVTYGPRGMYLYLNGESEAYANVTGGPPTGDTIYFGSPTALGNAKSIRGYIDSLRFSRTQRTVFPSALNISVETVASVARSFAKVKWLALQNETSTVKVSFYADRDTYGYDGTLIASAVANAGADSIDLSSLLAFGETYFVYAIATDSDYSTESARDYFESYFQAYSPLSAILASQKPASDKACLITRYFGFADLSMLRSFRDRMLDYRICRYLIDWYYEV